MYLDSNIPSGSIIEKSGVRDQKPFNTIAII